MAHNLKPYTGLYHEDNGTRTEYSISGATGYNDVTVGVDGTVYVSVSMSGSRYLYSKAPTANVFKKFTTYNNVRYVAIGPGGDIWIIGDNFQIMRWTGSKFEEPGNVTFNASSFAVGIVEGSIYAKKNGTADFYKWNESNTSFDKVNNITIDTFGVDGDGRPWICNDTTPVIKRARD